MKEKEFKPLSERKLLDECKDFPECSGWLYDEKDVKEAIKRLKVKIAFKCDCDCCQRNVELINKIMGDFEK